MADPQVTIVVVPRERFSCTRESLESIYEYTHTPFKLVYVDGNSPIHIKQYLEEQAQKKDFQLIRTEYYLSPNHARNLGLAQVTTKYVVFIDNDVIVSPGWLSALAECAEETNATVVGPLMCQHKPIHEIIHFAGGESHIWTDKKGRRRLREKMYKQGKRVEAVRDQLYRTQTELAEFHCVLVRTEIFERMGPLDERMLNTKEHLDFCMTIAQLGGTVYFEPACLVTYVPEVPRGYADLHFYMLRWSDAWTLASLHRLRDKWSLSEDGYFKYKYKKLGWRRKTNIVMPLIFKLTFGLYSPKLERLFMWLEHPFNRYLTDRYAQIKGRVLASKTSAHTFPSKAATPSQN